MINLIDEKITEYRYLLDNPVEQISVIEDKIICGNKDAICLIQLNF